MDGVDLYSQIDKNKRETFLIFLSFIFIFSSFSYLLGYISGGTEVALGYMFFGIIISFFSSFWSYFFSHKMVLFASGAKPAKGPKFRQVNNIVENLSIVAGIPKPKVYYIDDSAPNAFATGRNPKKAVVVVTTGLLEKLNKVELEGVIAHELAHIKNYDILVASIVAVLVGSIAFVSDMFLRGGFRRSRKSEKGSDNSVLIVLAIISLILTPIIAKLIQMSLSRNREFLADATGAYLTRYPKGLANALIKISQDKEILEASNRATAHLYIVNPLKGNMAKGLAKLFNTHPPVQERVQRLLAM